MGAVKCVSCTDPYESSDVWGGDFGRDQDARPLCRQRTSSRVNPSAPWMLHDKV